MVVLSYPSARFPYTVSAMAAGSFVFETLNIIVVWILLLYLGTSSAQTDRSCPLGRFCRLNANCTANTTFCVVQCPTESDLIQQGNHSTGNCESSKLRLHRDNVVWYIYHGWLIAFLLKGVLLVGGSE